MYLPDKKKKNDSNYVILWVIFYTVYTQLHKENFYTFLFWFNIWLYYNSIIIWIPCDANNMPIYLFISEKVSYIVIYMEFTSVISVINSLINYSTVSYTYLPLTSTSCLLNEVPIIRLRKTLPFYRSLYSNRRLFLYHFKI